MQGGWVKSIDVYCTGQNTCGVARTTYGTSIVTTTRWFNSDTIYSNLWDAAVIRTATTLPGTALTPSQYSSAGTARARLTGYTGSRAGVDGCGSYNACTQLR